MSGSSDWVLSKRGRGLSGNGLFPFGSSLEEVKRTGIQRKKGSLSPILNNPFVFDMVAGAGFEPTTFGL
jgi:hypothetical protein